MSNKIQGEGDYDAARRFNKREQEFVKKGVKTQPPLSAEEQEQFEEAESQGKQRAKQGGHDAVDADLFRRGEDKRATNSED